MSTLTEVILARNSQIREAMRSTAKITCQGTQPSRTSEFQHNPCGKKVAIYMAFQCRYCGFWFCPSCAEIHFGATLHEHVQAFDSFDGTTWE